ncbi:MAG: hypothetical protein ACRDP2_00775 [Nocardioidaceae bacterium]
MPSQDLSPFGPAPRDGTGEALPPDAMLRFTTAEGRLYPLAMTDPAGYERAITLVGRVADELRETAVDFGSVLAARPDLIERLPELARSTGVEVAGLPADAVVDAASALRCRELQARG